MPHIQRNCIGCGQVDDHPRHVTNEGDWHNDCHARSAFACDFCAEVVRHSGGKTGDELRAHINEHDPVGALLRAREAGESAPGSAPAVPAQNEPAPIQAAQLGLPAQEG